MPALPLHSLWQSWGASFTEICGWPVPASFGDEKNERLSLIENAALTDQSHRGKIRVSGSDRIRFLNNMLTNDIQSIPSGSGKRALLLTAQGKCLADFRVFVFEECVVLDTEPGLAAESIRLLDRFIITDDVRLDDMSAVWMELVLDGPQSAALAEKIKGHGQAGFLEAAASLSGCPAVHFFIPADAAAQTASLLQSLRPHCCGHNAFDAVRREQKVPRFKIDFDETWVLNETGLEETAASETKGCYPGQEVVARIKTYKKDVRRLFL